jgi:hypothetical protein
MGAHHDEDPNYFSNFWLEARLKLAKRLNRKQPRELRIGNGQETGEESKEKVEEQRRQSWNPDSSAALKARGGFTRNESVPELSNPCQRGAT